MNLHDILKKSRDEGSFSREELVAMLALPCDSLESYAVMGEASRISREASGNRAEIHAQLCLNLAPCPRDCLFCSFAAANNIFSTSTVVPPDEAVSLACRFEADGANAVYVMATAAFDMGLFLETSKEIRCALRPETVMIANIGDEGAGIAAELVQAGYQGVYHALRLREGVDTTIDPARRLESIRLFQDAGLIVGTCVEPIGPEHANEELADMIRFTALLGPAFSGAARRIPIPGTALAARGTISELRMAQIVAVTRLAMPRTVAGNCSHEPGTLPVMGGANLLWAEAGANPRDTRERTEEGRGHTVTSIRQFFKETEWPVLEGPSRFFAGM